MSLSINLHSSFSNSIALTGLYALALVQGASANDGSFGDLVEADATTPDVTTTAQTAQTAQSAATTAVLVAASNVAASTVALTTATTTGNTQLIRSEETPAKSAVTAKSAATGASASDSKGSVTYNQWGFTGSQSIWEATTAETSTVSSLKSHTSLVASVTNSTSNANRLHVSFERDNSWKNVIIIGGVLGLTAMLHSL